MFNAINPNINIKFHGYGHSNDNIVLKPNETIIDCSLGTNPFSYLSNVHNAITFGDIIDNYQYPKIEEYDELKKSIISYYGNPLISISNIHLGHGGLVLLERLATKFFKAKSKVIGIGPQFPYFILDHMTVGGEYESSNIVKNDFFDFNLEGLKSKLINNQYDICYLDNPNNPTGYYFDISLVEEVINICKDKGMVCLVDEAYGSFIEKSKSSFHLTSKYNNLIVLRSYSKGFGLSGARAAYIVCGDELSQEYKKIDNGFEPSAISIKLCIEASFHDNYMQESREKVKEIKQEFIPRLAKLGYNIYPNNENVSIFLMEKKGIDLHKFLLQHNILTTPGSGFLVTSELMNDSFVRVLVPKNIDTALDFIKRIS